MFNINQITNINRNKILYRIITINLVLLIFFIAILILNHIYFKISINKEFEQENIKECESVITVIDQQIIDMKKILYQQSKDKEILLLSYSQNSNITPDVVLQMDSIRDNLASIKKFRNDITDIYVYFKKYERIINTKGTMTKDLFFNKYLRSEEADLYNLIIDQNTINKLDIIKAYITENNDTSENKKYVHLFVYPVRDTVIMVAVNKEALDNSLKKIILNNDTIMLVLDQRNNIYTHFLNPLLENLKKNIPIDSVVKEGINNLLWMGKDYFVLNKKSDLTSMNYILMSDKDSLENKINEISLYAALLLGIFILLDIVIFILLKYEWHRPLKNILANLNVVDINKNCEYDLIQENILKTHKKIITMEKVLKQQEKIVEDNYINEMLSNFTHTCCENNYNININQKNQFVILTCVNEDAFGNTNSLKIQEIENLLQQKFDLYRIYSYSKLKSYFVKITSPQCYKTDLHSVFKAIQSNDVYYIAGVSKLQDNIKMIGNAYQQTQSSINESYIKQSKEDMLFFYNDIDIMNKEYFDISIDIETKLANCVLEGDIQEVKKNLEIIFSKNNTKSYGQQKEMFIYLTGLLRIIINSKSIDLDSCFDTEVYQFVQAIKNIYNLDLIKHMLVEWFEKTTEKMAVVKEQLIDEILSYIDQNFNKSISLDTISKELNMSSGYISQYFKKVMGINYVKYIQKIRIEHSKSILKEGQKPICDIAYDVGFGSVNTFIKVFKKSEGITPGNFRKSNYNSTD